MSPIVNLTAFAAAPLVDVGVDGQYQVTAVVKATYTWDDSGRASPIEARPILSNDEYAGAKGQSGLLRASELGPQKAKVDVLLAGALAFASPITAIDVELSLGSVLRKQARVFGDRYWLPAMTADVAPSQPRPVSRIPIAWERCFGGSDPSDPKHIEPHNPAGSGVAKKPQSLEGKLAPNFEDPSNLLPVRLVRPATVGFGPVAAHWPQRSSLAGTYDEVWQKTRRPLLPADFSQQYFNVAPEDQQIDAYKPGEELRLINMTTTAGDHIRLPMLEVPITFVTSEELSEDIAVVDTIIVEPDERRFSLVARAQTDLPQGPMSLARIVIGELTQGMRKAIERGKNYPWRKSRRGRA